MKEILSFNKMKTNLTLWENTKAFFSIPNYESFKAVGEIDDHILTILQTMYNGLTDDMFIPWKGSSRYLGIPLNYCPIDAVKYDSVYNTKDKRLSYESSWAFSSYNELGESISMVVEPFKFVRGKIARLTTGKYEGDWHTDEDPREVLKIVIPLKTDDSYKFQIEGSPPFRLSVGEVLLFDASIPHRVLCDGISTNHRDYLILSLPIWFHIDQNLNIKRSAYFGLSIPNAFYQETKLFRKT